MRAWSFWSASGQVKGPHGKGTHPSVWGLGAATAARTPRKTVLKRVEMRFILRTYRAQGLRGSKKVVGWFYGRTLPLRNGQATSVLTLDMAEIRGQSARVGQIPGKPGKLVQPFKRSPGISEINQAFYKITLFIRLWRSTTSYARA